MIDLLVPFPCFPFATNSTTPSGCGFAMPMVPLLSLPVSPGLKQQGPTTWAGNNNKSLSCSSPCFCSFCGSSCGPGGSGGVGGLLSWLFWEERAPLAATATPASTEPRGFHRGDSFQSISWKCTQIKRPAYVRQTSRCHSASLSRPRSHLPPHPVEHRDVFHSWLPSYTLTVR